MYDSITKINHFRKLTIAGLAVLISSIVLPFLFAGIVALCFPNNMETLGILFFITPLLWAISIFILISNKNKFRKMYSDTIVKSILDEYFDDVRHDSKGGFSREKVASFELVTDAKFFSSEDYLAGTYKGIKFEQADVTIETGGDNSTTLFGGRIFAFEFSKWEIDSVKVTSKENANSKTTLERKLSKLANAYYKSAEKRAFRKLEDVKMESEAFNRLYAVSAANPHDAFFVLTPHFMEKIQSFATKYTRVLIHFTNNNLYVAIEGCPDCFNPSLWKPIDYVLERKRVRNDVHVIIDVIDSLMIDAPTEEHESNM